MCKCRVRQDAGSDRSVRRAPVPLTMVSRGSLHTLAHASGAVRAEVAAPESGSNLDAFERPILHPQSRQRHGILATALVEAEGLWGGERLGHDPQTRRDIFQVLALSTRDHNLQYNRKRFV